MLKSDSETTQEGKVEVKKGFKKVNIDSSKKMMFEFFSLPF